MLSRMDYRFCVSNPSQRIEHNWELKKRREQCLKEMFDSVLEALGNAKSVYYIYITIYIYI